ncbi:MAG TPA: hypothetical protein VGZ33_05165 [Acidimicrobiales bacterium]|nr:hypothetical protein [Acidimicrobiales bacterium]
MLAVAHALVAHGSLAIPHSMEGQLGANGHSYYGIHGIAQSVIALPAIAVALLLGHLVHHEAALESLLAASMMPLLGGLIAVEVYRISRRIGGSARWSAVVAFGAIWCTYLFPYVDKLFFSEPLACLSLLWAIDALLSDRIGWASLALGVAILTRFECVLVVPAFCLVEYLRCRGLLTERARLIRVVSIALGSVLAVSLTALYNAYRFGGVASTGYPKGQYLSLRSVPTAVFGLLFSSHKSMFVFAPILLVVPWALVRLRAGGAIEHHAFWLLTTNFAAAFIANVMWSGWTGDWAWGPRLLLPGVVPLFCAVGCLGRHVERVIVSIALGVGALVSASTLVVSTQYQQLVGARSPAVWPQYQGLPNVLRYTAHHFEKSGQAPGSGASRHFVLMWQIGIVRELGDKGIPIALVGTLLLVVLALLALNQLRLTTRTAPAAGKVGDRAPTVTASARLG